MGNDERSSKAVRLAEARIRFASSKSHPCRPEFQEDLPQASVNPCTRAVTGKSIPTEPIPCEASLRSRRLDRVSPLDPSFAALAASGVEYYVTATCKPPTNSPSSQSSPTELPFAGCGVEADLQPTMTKCCPSRSSLKRSSTPKCNL